MVTSQQQNIHAVILCGGSGTRLWPLSKEQRPKQFLALGGSKDTLIQTTLARMESVSRIENRWLVLSKKHESIAREQVGDKVGNFLLEPMPKNTAAAVMYAANEIYRKDPNGIMVIVSSDHLINTKEEFENTLFRAIELAKSDDKFVVLGIKPSYPSTGFGYIEMGIELPKSREGSNLRAYEVAHFREKPDLLTAQSFTKSGKHLWNAGMFIWRVSSFIETFQKTCPEVAIPLLTQTITAESYSKLPSLPIDIAFVEKIPQLFQDQPGRIACVPAEFSWQDIGTWGAVREAFLKDSNGNVISGDVFSKDTTNSVIHSDGPTIAAIGCNNMVIIATKEAVLVMPEGKAQDVKLVSEWLKEQGKEQSKIQGKDS